MIEKNQQNRNRAFVLLFSFMSVHLVNLLGADFYTHYLSLSLTSLLVIRLCTLQDDLMLFIYASIQAFAMIAYIGLFTSFYEYFDSYLYDGLINLSSIMLSYELAMIFFLGGASVRATIDWMRDVGLRAWYVSQNVNKVSKQ